MGAPKGLPSWLTQADLDYYVNEFTASGFRGGINFYRNFHRNWEITPELADRKISQPTDVHRRRQGRRDPRRDRRAAHDQMSRVVTDFRGRDAHPRRRPLGAAGESRANQRGAARVSCRTIEAKNVALQ